VMGAALADCVHRELCFCCAGTASSAPCRPWSPHRLHLVHVDLLQRRHCLSCRLRCTRLWHNGLFAGGRVGGAGGWGEGSARVECMRPPPAKCRLRPCGTLNVGLTPRSAADSPAHNPPGRTHLLCCLFLRLRRRGLWKEGDLVRWLPLPARPNTACHAGSAPNPTLRC
jgi:hypothetical protein